MDGKGVFREGLLSIRKKVEERYYTSNAAFSAELASVFTSEIGVQPAGNTAELQMQISGRAPELSLEQREKRTLAKRIIKAIQPALEDAIKKESELNRKPFEKELKELDHILENSVRSRENSVAGSAEPIGTEATIKPEGPNGVETGTEGGEEANAKPEPQEEPHATALPEKDEDHDMPDADTTHPPEPAAESHAHGDSAAKEAPSEAATHEPEKPTADVPSTTAESTAEAQPMVNGDGKMHPTTSPEAPKEAPVPQEGPPTPPLSSQGNQEHPFAQGGIQWYMQPFDPVGTTIHEERWTGRDVMRGMSEELSELDEDELLDLVDDELEGKAAPQGSSGTGTGAEPQAKVHQTRRRSTRHG